MARRFRIHWNNYFDLAIESAALIASSEADDFPVENLQHVWRKRQWRSTGFTDEWIECDLGEVRGIDALIIENHNFNPESPITDVHIQATNDDPPNWAAPALDEELVITDIRILHEFASTQNYRFWRLLMDDPAGESGDFFAIGRIYLGDYFEFRYHYRTKHPGFVDPSERVMSDGGQASSNQLERYRGFSFNWSPGAVSETELEDLYEIFELVGGAIPYWITWDTEATPPTATLYVLNSKDWDFDPVIFERYGFSLEVEEAR